MNEELTLVVFVVVFGVVYWAFLRKTPDTPPPYLRSSQRLHCTYQAGTPPSYSEPVCAGGKLRKSFAAENVDCQNDCIPCEFVDVTTDQWDVSYVDNEFVATQSNYNCASCKFDHAEHYLDGAEMGSAVYQVGTSMVYDDCVPPGCDDCYVHASIRASQPHHDGGVTCEQAIKTLVSDPTMYVSSTDSGAVLKVSADKRECTEEDIARANCESTLKSLHDGYSDCVELQEPWNGWAAGQCVRKYTDVVDVPECNAIEDAELVRRNTGELCPSDSCLNQQEVECITAMRENTEQPEECERMAFDWLGWSKDECVRKKVNYQNLMLDLGVEYQVKKGTFANDSLFQIDGSPFGPYHSPEFALSNCKILCTTEYPECKGFTVTTENECALFRDMAMHTESDSVNARDYYFKLNTACDEARDDRVKHHFADSCQSC